MSAASNYAAIAQELYIAYFGRPADVLGLSSIEAALAAADTAGTAMTAAGLLTAYSNNPAIAAIVDSFGNSHESQALYGTNTLNFVTSVFESLFNRAPLASGLLFWANAINSGAYTTGEAALAILAGASAADMATVNAKVTVAEEFTSVMSSSSVDTNAYQGAVAAAIARSLLQGVTSANYAGYATNGDIQATLADIAGQGVPVTSYALTSGIDTLNLLGNNNHVAGSANGAGATFGVGDSISAAAGSTGNMLTLSDMGTGGTWSAGAQAGITVANIQDVVLASGEAVNANLASSVEGFSGLQSLNVAAEGGTQITAPSSAAVNVVDVNAAGGQESVDGGSSVTMVLDNVTTFLTSSVHIGSSAAPTGAITLTTNESPSQTTNGAPNINITGGTTVSVTANLAGAVNNTVYGGSITINGGAATTTVSVTQSAEVAASATTSGTFAGNVTINDINAGSATAAGTITSISIANCGAAQINDNALTNLSLSGTVFVTTIDDNLTAPTATTLTLEANALNGLDFSDSHREIATLNIVTGGTAASAFSNFSDDGLKTLNLSGTEAFSLSNVSAADLAAVNVSGGAGLTMSLGSATAFASTSTGTDVITIASAATEAIKGNGTAGEELIWNASAAPAGTTYLGDVSGFKVLGIGSAVAGTAAQTFDMSQMPGFTAFDVQQNSSGKEIQLLNVAPGSALTIDGSFYSTLVYSTADSSGPADAVTVNVGAAGNTPNILVATLTLEDSQHDGIGTVNIVSNTHSSNTIANFQDASLTALNITGPGGLQIGPLTVNSGTLSINAASTGSSADLSFVALSDTNLATLTLTGSENVLMELNQGTGNFTLAGSNYNGGIDLILQGATAVGKTLSIVLGNGQNTVDLSNALGSVVAVFGNGSDLANVGGSATSNTLTFGSGQDYVHELSTATATVTFAAHSDSVADQVLVGHATSATVAVGTVITGMNADGADTISFYDNASSFVQYSAAQINALGGNLTTLAQVVEGVLTNGGLVQHAVGEFSFQGNTYFVEQANTAGSAFAAGDSLVELTGLPSITSATTVSSGQINLHG